jgi:hypothetical protein
METGQCLECEAKDRLITALLASLRCTAAELRYFVPQDNWIIKDAYLSITKAESQQEGG